MNSYHAPLKSIRSKLVDVTRVLAIAYVSAVIAAVAWSLAPIAVGWKPVVVLSGSMMPALDPGDIVLYAPVTAYALVPGDIVLVDNPAHAGTLLSHRFVRLDDDGRLITKGDANQVVDSTPVAVDHLFGRARLVVPHVGAALMIGSAGWVVIMPWVAAFFASITWLLSGSRPNDAYPSSRSASRGQECAPPLAVAAVCLSEDNGQNSESGEASPAARNREPARRHLCLDQEPTHHESVP